mmetsp:Transcript_20391/g.45401  ORF Transcript_20391/g.45401 Transcript_20391/m.45401 type:complete len:271 (-) Transcript_20391:431-1243(-)|eukprot:CAMPEP_0173350394 /NCGR_PEP_ID=MMETSP1144-20121109/14846_1 /TAXON_ID=483371 /ORGANISM="non described non described, Strain CCMP2298" /LENGTH=270 /DNA_ID=CAMNT_0014298309 /DNA_START=34 /DNA_END=846 /DNA_ORIENTATION=-
MRALCTALLACLALFLAGSGAEVNKAITGFIMANESTCDSDCQKLVGLFQKQYSKNWAQRHPGIITAYAERNCEVVVEVGVARGELAYALLDKVGIREYHAVDPFVGGYDKRDLMSKMLSSMNASKAWGEAVLEVEKPFGGRFRLHQGASEEMVKHFPPSSVDCVFIDGTHTFKGAQLDIQVWTPILKPGGYYFFDDYSRFFMGVVYAIDGFFGLNKIDLVPINKHNNMMARKPDRDLLLEYPCVCAGIGGAAANVPADCDDCAGASTEH